MNTTTLRGFTAAQRELADRFLASGGSIRKPHESRKSEGSRRYKKGWEIRFNVASKTEAAALQALLQRAGLQGGRPYKKRPNRWIQPLYGRDHVQQFLGWLDQVSR